MTLQRTRSAVTASLLAVLVLLTATLPAPGAEAPLLDARGLASATDGVRVLVTGAVDDVHEAVARVGGEVVGHLPIVGAVAADVPPASIEELGSAAGVASVTENVPMQLQEDVEATAAYPADAAGPATLGAPDLWDEGIDGDGVGIAVLDTGITEVDDLAGRVVGGVDMTPEQDGRDNYGHGTPIASLAAGSTVGVAPGAHVVPVKIAGEDGRTDIIRVLVGLEWIAAHAESLDIGVVNLSLGATPIASELVDAAVQRLWDQGLVVVVSAGNDGPDSLGTPASNTHAVTVGATRGHGTAITDDDVIAPWSSNGVDADGNPKPDVTAPGQSLVAVGAPGSWGYDAHPESHLDGGRQRISGTSFSTGLISGAAALIRSAHPDWEPDEVLGQLVASGQVVDGTDAVTPWLPTAIDTASPELANVGASEHTLRDARERLSGEGSKVVERLRELRQEGTADLEQFREEMRGKGHGAEMRAKGHGAGMPGMPGKAHGAGWYDDGWEGAGWYGAGWYGAGWYGAGWYGAGWYGAGWYGAGWYGAGWYGAGWYGAGWYGAGWYGAGWY